MNRGFLNLKRQRGVTLMEVLAVMIIGLLMIIGAFTLYSTTQNKQREGDILTAMMTLQTNIRDLYYGKNSYEDITASTIVAAGAAPSTLVGSNGTSLVSPYDSASQVTITSGTGDAQFEILVPAVPQDSCISLSTKRGSFNSVEANGTAIEDIADATGACTDGDNAVTFISN